MNLLDASASRKMVRAGASGRLSGKDEDMEDDFQREGGRMVIREEEAEGVFDDERGGKRKRNRNDGFDSEDSDFDDLKGFSGISLALKGSKSIAQASSIAASLGGKSLARSQGGRGTDRQGAPKARGSHHTGDRFKSRKKGTGGDVKGNSKVEPYAYWPLDRKLLNRRVQKTRTAKAGLDRVVKAAEDGAARGRKAKRMRKDK